MNRLMFELYCLLRKRRLSKSFNKVCKAQNKLKNARKERIWIQNNAQIHILNYPYYKIKKWLFG